MFSHHARYLWYLVAGASTKPSVRLSESWWDDDYRRGGLDRIEGDRELPRLLLVAALTRHYAPGGAVLDIGCGTGTLVEPLRDCFPGSSLRYTGMDYSAVALQAAAARIARLDDASIDAPAMEFTHADFDEYRPRSIFDAIIFSESLNYAPDPLRTVLRYTDVMSEAGIVIVSLWRRPSRRRIWKALGGALQERSRSRVVVPRRPSWDIVVYEKRA